MLVRMSLSCSCDTLAALAGPFAAVKCDWGRPERVRGLAKPSLVCKILLAPTRVLQVRGSACRLAACGFAVKLCACTLGRDLAVQRPAPLE